MLQRRSPVRATINCGTYFTSLIPPKNHFFAHTSNPDRAIPNLVGFQYNIPLIANHFIFLLYARTASASARRAVDELSGSIGSDKQTDNHRGGAISFSIVGEQRQDQARKAE